MEYHDPRFSVIAAWVAGAVALTVALALPLGYYTMARSNLESAVTTTAEVQAEVVERAISSAPDVWMFQTHRLEEFLARHSGTAEDELATVLDRENKVIVQAGQAPRPPLLTHSEALFDAGAPVGEIRVARSLRGVLERTGIVALLGLVLAAVVFYVFRALPLRALHRVTNDLIVEKERAEVTLHAIGDAVIRTDAAGQIEYMNPAAEQLTGWSAEEFRGRSLTDALPLIDRVKQELAENPLTRALAERRTVLMTGHTEFVRRDGLAVAIEDSAAPIIARDGDLIGGVLVFHDVTAARKLATVLSWQASHDGLTGLPNRSDFELHLDAAMNELHAGGPAHVMCYLDLDNFKIVNDTCGHAAGDELLRQVAQLFREHVRGSDVLARLGGDEFGVLLLACPLDQAQRIAAELLSAIKTFRFAWQDKMFDVGVSIGMVEIIPSMRDREEVFRAADAACYTAKELGRGRAQIYRPADSELIVHHEEMGWTSRITAALEDRRFALYYQPYLPLSARADAAPRVELLLRMMDEDGRVIVPGAFIPAAERYNLMPRIDEWVIATAFAKYALLAGHFGDGLVVSINLSGTSLNDGQLLDYIREQTAAHHVRPGMICFEITESAAINNLRNVSKFMNELKADGFHFALDDFGSGLSSVTCLRSLPVDYLKIDGSLVKDLATDAVSRAMVVAINEVTHAMGLQTIAEFVHSEAVLDELRAIGVDYAQGYAVAVPQALPVSGQAGS